MLTVTDSGSGVQNVKVSVDDTTWYEAYKMPGNVWLFDLSSLGLQDGHYTLYVQATDNAGNVNTTSVMFTVDKECIVSGTVKDANGNAIANATVTLSNGMTTTTDSNGHFVLNNSSAGTYNVTVSKNGYTALMQSVSTTTGTTSNMGTLVVQSTPSSPSLSNGLVIGAVIVVIVALLAVAFVMYGKRKK